MEQINQYEIVLVNLDPSMESEMKKTRPCVVLSPNEMNRNLHTIIIAPMTSSSKPYPTRIKVNHNQQEGWVVIDQIRTIDRRRIVKKLDRLTDKEIQQVKWIINETLVQ